MVKAARNALIEREVSYSTVATWVDKFRLFAGYMRDTYGLKDLRWIERSHLVDYAEHLAEKVEAGELAVTTAHNRISAVNTVLAQARRDKTVWVSPVEYIQSRSQVATVSRAASSKTFLETVRRVAEAPHGGRLTVLMELQREVGLRFKESCLINAVQAFQQAVKDGVIKVGRGTKGGRARMVPIKSPVQFAVLRRAAEVQESARSLIPPGQSYKTFRQQAYRATEEGFHRHRHYYAQTRYRKLVGVDCPVAAGIAHGKAHHQYLARELGVSLGRAKEIDREARRTISAELGHGRVIATNPYLG